MKIRPERPEEFDRIGVLIKTAFDTAKVANGKEAEFVDRLRRSGHYRPELALVGEDENGTLLGHVMLTGSFVADGKARCPVLLLAPLAVVLAARRRGLGAELVREALRRAAELGDAAVLLVGDPAYYGRFGFRPASEFGIRPTQSIPDEKVMALELRPGALAGVRGRAECF